MARSTNFTTFWSVAAGLVAALAILQFCGQAILWFLPYHLAGFANESALLLLGLAAGALLARIMPRLRLSWPPWRAGLAIGLTLYVGASFAMLGWSAQTGFAFGAYRYTVFSAPGCEFTARFPGPANSGRLRSEVFEKVAGEAPQASVAVYADLASLAALRADCLAIPPGGAAENAALAATAARQWAQRIGMAVDEERMDGAASEAVFRLRGSIGGSLLPESAGGSGRTLAAIHSHIGARSVLTVYAFQPDDGSPSPLAAAFLDGVRRR